MAPNNSSDSETPTIIERSINKFRSDGLIAFVRNLPGYALRETIQRQSDPRKYLLLRHHVRRALYPTKWTDADPYQVLWIDPDEIKRSSPLRPPSRFGEVRGGNWDLRKVKISDLTVYRSLEDHFVDGVPLQETPLYDLFVARTEADSEWGHYSPDEWEDRVAEIRHLAHKIRSEGYKTQRQLLREDEVTTRFRNNDSIHPLLNEIRVDIARSGEYLWRAGGLHRLSLAKIFDLEKVPVIVITRHKEWQVVREGIREDASDESIKLPHADLRDLSK